MNKPTLKTGLVACPPGCLELNSQRDLAAHLRVSPRHAGRLLLSGAVRPVKSTAFQNFYSFADLAELRRDPLARIKRYCTTLTPQERELLAAELLDDRAKLAGAQPARLQCSLNGGAGLFG